MDPDGSEERGALLLKTRSGLELDLLLVLEGGVVGIEIKGRKTLVPSDPWPIREIAGALKGEWRGGIVVYEGDMIVKMAEPSLWAVPARRLFI
jgi:hypothetical protein